MKKFMIDNKINFFCYLNYILNWQNEVVKFDTFLVVFALVCHF